MKSIHFDDPVAAYDRLAAHYAGISRRRAPYLERVEREVIWRIPARSRSILDIGAGDGTRALRIAAGSGIRRIVLLEPSSEMCSIANSQLESGGCAHLTEPIEVWPVRAESLTSDSVSERFDVITCLWNVLGHIAAEKREPALRAVCQLLSPYGKFFIDINHRYNLRAYGLIPTCGRWLRDHLSPMESNGDVRSNWNVGQSSITTYGHVFTDREIMHLAAAAGLEMEQRIVIDYEVGRVERLAYQGNLLYVFRRSSRIDSSSAPQTS